MKKWVIMLLFITMILCSVATVNYLGDPANVFSDIEKEMALAMSEGNSVSVTTGNCEERKLKKYLIEQMDSNIDCIAVGPSTVTYIDLEIVGENEFYNLGVSSGNYYDLMAQFALLKEQGVHADRVILNVTISDFTTGGCVAENTASNELMNYSLAMIDFLRGDDFVVKDNTVIDKFSSFMAKPLLSVSYFQSSMDRLLAGGIQQDYAIVGDNCEQSYYLKDGSRGYYKGLQEKTESDVMETSKKTDQDAVVPCKQLDKRCVSDFELLVHYLKGEGTEVEFYICPFAPAMWDRLDTDLQRVMLEMNDFAYEFADENNIKVTGNSNPYELGITNAEFYDYGHIKKEYMTKYFDFTEGEK